jgi:hypothetical protein
MLRVSNLSGFGGRNRGPVTRELTASAVDNTDQKIFTFAGKSFGTETPDRVMAVSVELTGGLTTTTLTSVTIGGVAATKLVAASASGGFQEIWGTPKTQDAGPTGTSGNIVVTSASTANSLNCAIEVYAIKGAASATPDHTAPDTSSPLSVTIDVPANGVAIAGARGVSTPGNASWTGLTEDVDAAVDGGVSASTSASAEFTTAQTGLTVSVSFAAGTATGLAVASWGP